MKSLKLPWVISFCLYFATSCSHNISEPYVSSLRDPNNQFDYIMVAPKRFRAALQPLVDLRQGEGLEVALVDVQ